MKKIIAALTLFLAFSISASAQEKPGYIGLDAAGKGKKQAAELAEFLGLDKTVEGNFAMLFEQKFLVLDDKNTQPERKTEVSRVVEAKIRGTLDGNQMERLEKNTELFQKLIK